MRPSPGFPVPAAADTNLADAPALLALKGLVVASVEGWVERVRQVQTRRGRQQLGLYAFEGARLLKRALSCYVPLEAVLVGRGLREREASVAELLQAAQASGVRVVEVTPRLLADLGDDRASGQLVVLARLPSIDQHSWLAQTESPSLSCLVILDVEEPGNVGALARTALAARAKIITVGESDLYHPKALRTGMGAQFRLPRVHFTGIAACLSVLRDARVSCYAAVPDGGRSLYAPEPLPEALAIFIGNEASGLPADWISQIGESLSIPMPGRIDSLSVNAAAAVVLFEIERQRLERRRGTD